MNLAPHHILVPKHEIMTIKEAEQDNVIRIGKNKTMFENAEPYRRFRDDLDKVKTITSLIFLNMAPLHEKEFGDLLFFKSKQMLQELND